MTPDLPRRSAPVQGLARGAPLSRRRLLQLAGVAAAGLASGCSLRDEAADTSVAGEDGALRVLNWSEYVDPDEDGAPGTVTRFQQATGIPTTYDESYEGNYEALADIFEPVLGSGGVLDFDVVTPTYWLAQRMVRQGWIERLPQELIPNHANVDPAYLGMPWDRGARFHMPWQAGVTGIAYDPAAVGGTLSSIEDLFDPSLAGRVSFIGEMREAVGLVMLGQGADPSAARVDEATRALDRLEDHSARFGTPFLFNEFADGLRSGQLAAAMAWSGDVVQLQAERPDIRFVVPVEGAIRWFDTMVIPAGSPNRAAAARWMNFVYDPANAALITAWVQYISPVVGVRDELRRLGGDLADLADNPVLFPDDATARRLFTWGGMDLDDEDALDERFAVIAGL